MKIRKRNGALEDVHFEKVIKRLEPLARGLQVDCNSIAQRVIGGMFDGVSTREVEALAANTTVGMASMHPHYGLLAGRMLMHSLHKDTPRTLLACMKALHHNENEQGERMPLVSPEVYDTVKKHWKVLQEEIDYEKDLTNYDFFAARTLLQIYLTKSKGKTVERPQHMLMRVALGLWGSDIDRAVETYKLLSDKVYTHATPTLFHSGTPKPALSSCFTGDCDDSIDGIFRCVTQMAQMSKHAGGIGLSMSQIRSDGALIRGTNGVSSGVIPWLRIMNDTMRAVNQSGRRAGSAAIYLDTDHPDFMAFMDLRKNSGNEEARARDLFTAAWCSDLFFKRVEADEEWSFFDPDRCPGLRQAFGPDYEELYTRYEREGLAAKTMPAKKVFAAMLTSMLETGTPYVHAKDAFNRCNNQRNVGPIVSSNLCVAGDTYILTDRGQLPIASLVGQPIRVWNGEAWSETVVHQTGAGQQLLRVTFSNGMVLDCTPYHKFPIIEDAKARKKTSTVKEAQQLAAGDCLVRVDLPTIQEGDGQAFPHAYTHGFFCGDGTYNHRGSGQAPCTAPVKCGDFCHRHANGHFLRNPEAQVGVCAAFVNSPSPTVALYGAKKDLASHLDARTPHGGEDASGRINVSLPLSLPPKFLVPLNATLEIRLQWFAGWIDADGCTQQQKESQQIQATSTDMDFLRRIKLMLQTMGVDATIGTMHGPERTHSLLPDGKGGKKLFKTKPVYRIQLGNPDVARLVELGIQTHRLKLSPSSSDGLKRFVKVLSVEAVEGTHDTFCFNEPHRHMGIFGGIVTFQCSEISLASTPDAWGVCNLASINLQAFVTEAREFDYERLHGIVRTVARNLNQVIDRGFVPIAEGRVTNDASRPVGIGIQGLADVLARMRLPFESAGAATVNAQIAATMYHAAVEESVELAREHGAYHNFRGSPASEGKFQFDLHGVQPDPRYDWEALRRDMLEHGLRNSLLIALMPTATTSQLLGNTESFEPPQANVFLRKTLAGEHLVINKHLVADLLELGLWTEEVRGQLIAEEGSVQGIAAIPAEVRERYKTVWEVKQRVLIDLAAARAPYVCQAQSLNIHFAAPSFKTVGSALMYGWRKGLKCCCYYLRQQAPTKALAVNVPVAQCVSCSS